MAIANGYCTLAEIKARLGVTDTQDDAMLELVVQAVSRGIDNYCRRRFYTTANDETRYYTALTSWAVWTDDIISVTALSTDSGDRTYSTAWSIDDYDLTPDQPPYIGVCATPNGAYRFPKYMRGVKIVGKFGYSATPDVVREACLLQSVRLFKRKDAPFGIAGAGGMGQLMAISDMDPDVKALLAPPIRRLQHVR